MTEREATTTRGAPMAVSAFDLYSIGIGPSSSHTVGPMRAARAFAAAYPKASRVRVELFGSLAATGRGHGTEGAILLGLEGEDPATVDTGRVAARVAAIRSERRLLLGGKRPVSFDPDTYLVLHRRESLPFHPNGMRFEADGE